MQIAPANEINEQDWRRTEGVPTALAQRVDKLVAAMAEKHGASVRLSAATNVGTQYLFKRQVSSRVDVDRACAAFVADLGTTLNTYGLSAVGSSSNLVASALEEVRASQSDVMFLGWAKGSLRGAFKYLGAVCNPYTRPQNSYYDWPRYEKNFDEWAVPEIRNGSRGDCAFVIYSKESAFASRRGDRTKKIEAIEFMDKMMGRVLSELTGEVLVVVVADHSSDLEGYTNPVVNTCYIVAVLSADRSYRKAAPHFCEELAKDRLQGSIPTQRELVQYIADQRI